MIPTITCRTQHPFSFSSSSFLWLSIHLSPFVLRLTLPKSLSFFPGVFLTFSASVSVLGEKTEMLGWNQPPLLPRVLVCLARVFVCERAHAWAGSAVKVRLIHWLQLRGAEGLAEFNSNLFTLLRPANADCLRERAACHRERTGELVYHFTLIVYLSII